MEKPNEVIGVDAESALTFCTRTVKVIVRHSRDCKDARYGAEWPKCNCPKSLLIYEGEGSGRNRRVSAKTRSWTKAEAVAQEYRDGWDPEKQELKRLRAAKEQKEVRIENAVALYVADMVARLGDNGTVAMARSLFGNVDPETKAVVSNGHPFNWLDKLPAIKRPVHIADFAPSHLTQWRASWRFGDLTAANRWTMVRGFFNFCEAQGWIDDNPARKLKRPATQKGNRTAIFTDEQYKKILDGVPARNITNDQRPYAVTFLNPAWTFCSTDSGIRITQYPRLKRLSGLLIFRTPGSSRNSRRIVSSDKCHNTDTSATV